MNNSNKKNNDNYQESSDLLFDADVDTHIFSDGSCEGNGKKNASGGFSLLFTRGTYCGFGYYGRLSNTRIDSDNLIAPSNIRAEGIAILTILKKLRKKDKWCIAKIYTDSEFWIKMILEYMPKWSSEKFKTKKNPDLSSAIWKEWCQVPSEKKIHLQFVRAHRDEHILKDPYDKYCCHFNNLADIWAKESLNLEEGTIKKFKFNK